MVAEGEEWARSFRHDTTEERHSVRRAQSKRAHQSNLEVTIAPTDSCVVSIVVFIVVFIVVSTKEPC